MRKVFKQEFEFLDEAGNKLSPGEWAALFGYNGTSFASRHEQQGKLAPGIRWSKQFTGLSKAGDPLQPQTYRRPWMVMVSGGNCTVKRPEFSTEAEADAFIRSLRGKVVKQRLVSAARAGVLLTGWIVFAVTISSSGSSWFDIWRLLAGLGWGYILGAIVSRDCFNAITGSEVKL